MGDAPKLVLDFLDFPPFWITFKLLYCIYDALHEVLVHKEKSIWNSAGSENLKQTEKSGLKYAFEHGKKRIEGKEVRRYKD